MEDIMNTIEDAQYERAVTADRAPSLPWAQPSDEQLAEFIKERESKNPKWLEKEEVEKNPLGKYLLGECEASENTDWGTSEQRKVYMQMQWVRKKPVTLEDFRQFRVLGRGGFGMVTGVSRRQSGSMFANKIQNKLRVKDGKAEKLAIAERKALCAIDSPFVVNVHYAFQDKTDLYLVMELLSGGDLKYHLHQQKKFSEDNARYFLACTIEGIGAIHDAGYAYRDLKPENILMSSDGRIKISDLGLAARVSSSKKLKGSAGTRGYWAPEMITKNDEGKSQEYDERVDFWSFGCVAYAFIDGHCPFYSERVTKLYGADNKTAIDEATKKMDIEYTELFSPNAKSFCEGLLTRDPDQRLGGKGEGWKEIISHPFFEGYDFEAMRKPGFEPPFKPSEALNANSQQDIGGFDRAKGVKWEEADQEKFADWEFTHRRRFFEEVVEYLEWRKKNPEKVKENRKSSACSIS